MHNFINHNRSEYRWWRLGSGWYTLIWAFLLAWNIWAGSGAFWYGFASFFLGASVIAWLVQDQFLYPRDDGSTTS